MCTANAITTSEYILLKAYLQYGTLGMNKVLEWIQVLMQCLRRGGLWVSVEYKAQCVQHLGTHLSGYTWLTQ